MRYAILLFLALLLTPFETVAEDAGIYVDARIAKLAEDAPEVITHPAVITPDVEIPEVTVRHTEPGTFLGVLGAISIFLYKLVRILRKVVPILADNKYKDEIRVGLLTIGGIAALLGYFAAGVSAYDALYLFAAGPGAIVLNELAKVDWKALFKKKPEEVV
jgi:hypothetical protein